MANNISQSTAVKTTRAGLILCAVLGILLTVFGLLPAVGEYVIHAALNFKRGILPPLIASLTAPALMATLCWYLLTNADKIAQACFPEDPPGTSDVERALYRIIFTALGLLILVMTLPQFIHAVGNTFIVNDSDSWSRDWIKQFSLHNLPYIVAFVFQFGAAVYLIWGAPQLVKWQTRRSVNDQG